jgi:hypothetical protein
MATVAILKGESMTTLYEEKVRCSVCRAKHKYTLVGSTNRFGSPDLDTRPPEMERSAISYFVQRCPKCGYCASDVSKASPEAQTVVNRKEYKDQLNDPTYPVEANSFLCKAIIHRECREFAAATMALIHAAWVCDDSGHLDQARTCRQKAADMLTITERNDQEVSGQQGAVTAILVDLLRRSGQVEEARRVIAERRDGITEDIIARVLDYQTTLLDKNDVSCHTIAEAVGGGG